MPEHPAARQARSRAWQQIAAIGPGGGPVAAARGPRAQAVAMAEGNVHGDSADGTGPGEVEGIVWLNAAINVRSAWSRCSRSQPSRYGSVTATCRPAAWLRGSASAWRGSRRLVPRARFLLWVDAVGGYLVCLDDHIIPGPGWTPTATPMSR